MESPHINPVALLAAVIAAALALTAARGDFGYLSTIGGLTVLLVLFAYDQQGYRGVLQSFAFAAVCGFCLMLASGFGLLYLNLADPTAIRLKWLPLTWLVATFVLTVVDRMRMTSRESFSMRLTPGAAPPPVQHIAAAAPASLPYMPPPYMPPPAPAPSMPLASAPPPAPEPRPTAIPVRPGKETMIYLSLVGEGLNVLRTVRAEHLGRDFYRIIDDMPEGETWEFQPGQVVRCKKKSLSNGKGLVAFEEAPRAS